MKLEHYLRAFTDEELVQGAELYFSQSLDDLKIVTSQ